MVCHIENLRHIFQKGVNSVQPLSLFTQSKIINKINSDVITINNNKIDLTNKKCHLVGFGKAVLGMAVQVERVLGKNLKTGILSIPVGVQDTFKNNQNMQLKNDSVIKIYEGAKNNLPDEKSLKAAKEIFSLASSMSSDDILFVLVSGGGSALLPLPIEPLQLNSKLEIIRKLSNAGATIEELNTVRICMSKTKGGKLAMAAKNSNSIYSFVISDIIGDPIDLIASGPTVQYKTSKNQLSAKSILEQFNIWNSLSEDVKLIFENKSKNEMNDIFPKNSHVFIIGSNRIAVKACESACKELSYIPFLLSTSIKGNVESVCEKYINFLQNLVLFKQNSLSSEKFKKLFLDDFQYSENFHELIVSTKNLSPFLLILAGEPSVKITGNGLGGRNQELALRISLELYKNNILHNIFVLCAGTDGIDGPTSAAGAIGNVEVIEDYLKDNKKTIKDIENVYIQNNDSFNFYKNLRNGKYHINIGHTGTNVMDLHLVAIDWSSKS
ncbi:glycerate kinase [Condylostylus longicornis]|uniref:glycerate kinase n=1 Tax=Condylostylus longicornis TaxID=2530218 RepID=UPI00244E32A9|nr:glycerate kinase [Condylostylus longicornis]